MEFLASNKFFVSKILQENKKNSKKIPFMQPRVQVVYSKVSKKYKKRPGVQPQKCRNSI